MQTTDLVQYTYLGMHFTLNFGALDDCKLAYIQHMAFWGQNRHLHTFISKIILLIDLKKNRKLSKNLCGYV